MTEVDKTRPAGGSAAEGGANAASNGYWLHDDFGPRAYVAPDAAPLPAGRGLEDLMAAIEDRLALLPEAETRRVHVAATGGRLVLSGIVGSAEARRRVGARVVAAAGEVPVENRLQVGQP